MNYEKAYKAVLQTATQWIKDGCTDKERICLECVFPELRESEDERIRTRLIEYFQGFLKGYEDCYKDGGFVRWEGLDVKSIIAWLEKQKEHKPKNILTDDDSLSTAYNKGVTDVVEDPEAYGLCKPAEWSEEDEQLIGFIFDLLNGLVWRKDWAMSKEECLERLKSLRPSWKPSEWNREDKNRHYYLCNLLRETYDKVDKSSCIDDAISWLEDLPTRVSLSSWKPSEEQMMALHYASYGGELLPDELLLLDSLYNQLSELI